MRFPSITARLCAAALLYGSMAMASDIAYCSPQNTGSSYTPKSSIYQSNGLCEQQCSGEYAFAVVQGKKCWCSNYVPAIQNDISDCSTSCPGYPDDKCGNEKEGLFGYIELSGVLPSGTAKPGQTTTTSSKTSTSSVPTVTVTAHLSSETTFATSKGNDEEPTSIATSVRTVAGQPVTITVEPTAATAASNAGDGDGGGSSLSGGAIAGIVIGTLVGVGAIVALALWFLLFGRRRPDPATSPSPDARLVGSYRPSSGPQMDTVRNSFSPVSPVSPHDYLGLNGGGPATFTDSRLKKDAILGSRNSTLSLRDEVDYSRPVLRLTNPD